MQKTKHGRLRCQQRGIKDDFLQIIMQEGNTKKLLGGAIAYSL